MYGAILDQQGDVVVVSRHAQVLFEALQLGIADVNAVDEGSEEDDADGKDDRAASSSAP